MQSLGRLRFNLTISEARSRISDAEGSFERTSSCSERSRSFLRRLKKNSPTHPPFFVTSFSAFLLLLAILPISFSYIRTLHSCTPLQTRRSTVIVSTRAHLRRHLHSLGQPPEPPPVDLARPPVRFSGTTGAFIRGARFGSTRNRKFCTNLQIDWAASQSAVHWNRC
jgi:hypothetical protein